MSQPFPVEGVITAPRLSRALNKGFQKMRMMRQSRVRFLNQMIGRFYTMTKQGSDEEIKASPINLLHTAVTTVVPNLVFNDPQLAIRSEIIEYRDYASVLELAVNKQLKSIKFRKTLRRAIMDSIVAAGFLKHGLAQSRKLITIDGVDIDVGEIFLERVDPDDMILDPNARDWDEQNIIANRYDVNKIDALEAGFDETIIRGAGTRFDTHQSLREASAISGGRGMRHNLFERIDLIDVWVPRDQAVYTMAWQPGHVAQDFLNISDNAGPEEGPYIMLGYTDVPDNILPVPPASLWYDLHILSNRIARKIARQAERLKRVLIYDGEAIDDATLISDADDGETLQVNNVDGVKEVTYGGTTEDAYKYSEWLKLQFSEQANNLDQLAGLKSDVPTLGQSEILQANASIRLADLQNQVNDFVAQAGDAVKLFLHTDPLIELPLARRRNGIEEQVLYTPEMRKGEILDFTTTTVPFSMARQDPNVRVRRLLEFATAAVPAAAQAAQILGPAFKVDKFLIRIAKEIGVEDVDEWLDFQQFSDFFMAKFLSSMDQGNASQVTAGPTSSFGGLNVGQPVPGQMGPSGGITLDQEQNIGRQATSAEAQVLR